MRKHLTSIVLVVLAAAFAIYLAIDWGKTSTTEANERKRSLVPGWRRDDIAVVAVDGARGAGKIERGEKDSKGQRPWWIVTAKGRFPADEQAVDALLGVLEFATFDHEIEHADRKALGLEPPKASLAITMGSEKWTILLGGPTTQPSGGAYVEVPTRGVYAVSADLAKSLVVDLDALREKRIIAYLSTDLRALDIEGAGGAKKIVRAPWSGSRGAGFRFDEASPERGARVDADRLDRIWVAFSELTASAFLDDADADKRLVKEVSLTLTPKDGPPSTLDLGGACPGKDDSVVAIRRTPSRISACVPKAALAALEVKTDELVDRRLFAPPPDEVTEVAIKDAAREIELARSGEGWHLRKPRDAKVDQDPGDVVSNGVLRVNGVVLLRDEDIAEAKEKIKKAPAPIALRLSSLSPLSDGDAGGERVEEADVYEPSEGDDAFALRKEDGAWLRLTKAAVADLRPNDALLRSRRIFEDDLKNVKALRLERDGIVQKLERTDSGAFKWLEPKRDGLTGDIGFATELAETMVQLEALRWASERDRAQYGLEKPRAIVEVDVDGRTLRLAIGAQTIDGAYARASEAGPIDEAKAPVFVVAKVVESAAMRWLVDRDTLEIDEPTMTSATIVAGAKKVTLTKRGESFHLEPDDDAAKAAAIHDALGDLMSEGAVSIGPASREQGFDRPAAEITVEHTDASKRAKLIVGNGDTFRGIAIRYVRKAGVDATFAVAQAKLRAVLDAVAK